MRHFFGFTKEPFSPEVRVDELYHTAALEGAKERFLYAVNLGAISVITGDVGSGKSTALRYAASSLHPSRYRLIPVVASTGSIIEVLKQISIALDVEWSSISPAKLMHTIRGAITEIAKRKEIPILIIDEASLLRIEVFAQLHTLGQFEMDSKPLLPIILAGQNNLLDKLMYLTSRPLASRVIGRSHLDGLKQKDMTAYLKHHLEIAGIAEQLFSDEAILAIHQGSGGLLRRANLLAKGSLIAASREKCMVVSAEHVRMAATEIF
jgi:type II secretory pathway predicted ATPase ExeA